MSFRRVLIVPALAVAAVLGVGRTAGAVPLGMTWTYFDNTGNPTLSDSNSGAAADPSFGLTNNCVFGNESCDIQYNRPGYQVTSILMAPAVSETGGALAQGVYYATELDGPGGTLADRILGG